MMSVLWSLWLKSCVSVSGATDGERFWPLDTQSYWLILFVSMFWLSMFFSGYEITDAKSAHPHFFTSHSALIFQLWTSCQEESSSSKDGVGGLSCSSLSLLDAFCIPDAFSVCPRTFKIFLFKVGSLLGSCSSPVHHGLVIIPLLDTWWQTDTHTHRHIFNIINIIQYIISRK